MNRALPALVLILIVAACAAPVPTSAPTPVPTPPTPPIPTSPADLCSRAELHVANGSSEAYSVNLNGGWEIVSEPDSDRLVVDHGGDRPPALPWAVEVRDQHGRQVMAFTVDAPDSALISITDDGVSQTVSNVATGCSSSAPPSARAQTSGDPYAGLPSNACGGFHLKVVNDTSGPVTIGINDAWTSTIGAGVNQVINETFTQPRLPLLPWNVVIKDVNGQSIFSGIAGDTPVDQKVTLSDDGAPIQTPYDLAEDC